MGFSYGANCSTTAVGQSHKSMSPQDPAVHRWLGTQTSGTGAGGSSQGHKEPFRAAGAQPGGAVPARAWPAAPARSSALSVLCADS